MGKYMMKDVRYLLSSNTFGRTYSVIYLGASIGLVQKCGDWWYTSPVTDNPVRSLANLDGDPHRVWTTRKECFIWLLGLKDANEAWFGNAMMLR